MMLSYAAPILIYSTTILSLVSLTSGKKTKITILRDFCSAMCCS